MTYDLLILEVTIDITGSLESSYGLSPLCRRWIPIRDIVWRGPPSEEPDIDLLAGPFCRDDSTADGVEARPIRARVLALNVTPGVGGLARRIDVAVTSS